MGARIQLDQLPPALRAQAEAQLSGKVVGQSVPRKRQRAAGSGAQTDNGSPGPEPKCNVGDEPLGEARTKAGDSAFYVVRVTSFRRRLLDTDNLCPKYAVDALRYAGILPQDSPDRAQIIPTQEKVSSVAEQRTEILVTKYPGGKSQAMASATGLYPWGA